MNTRPTPETDKFFATFADGEYAPSHAEYYVRLQDLELERDHWKALATQYSVEREHNAMQALAYKAERDEARANMLSNARAMPPATESDHGK